MFLKQSQRNKETYYKETYYKETPLVIETINFKIESTVFQNTHLNGAQGKGQVSLFITWCIHYHEKSFRIFRFLVINCRSFKHFSNESLRDTFTSKLFNEDFIINDNKVFCRACIKISKN